MTLSFAYNTKKMFLVSLILYDFLIFTKYTWPAHEFKYVYSQILCYKRPCCYWGTLFYEVHPPVDEYIMDEKVLAVVLLHVDTNLSLHGRNRPNWFKSRPPFTNVIFIS